MSVTEADLADWFQPWQELGTGPFTYENVTADLDEDDRPTRQTFDDFTASLGSGRCKVCASDQDYIGDCGMCAFCLDDEAVSR